LTASLSQRVAIRGFLAVPQRQTTIAQGGTHFIVLNVAANAEFIAIGPGFSYTSDKPSEDLIIKIITVRPGNSAPAGAQPDPLRRA
jgi:hypothetical protein